MRSRYEEIPKKKTSMTTKILLTVVGISFVIGSIAPSFA
jgi:hypothetical protein